MANPFERDDIDYLVLVNDEGQYSLWPSFTEIPGGWRKVMSGGRQTCLDYVDEHWTDMRPLSLVRQMQV